MTFLETERLILRQAKPEDAKVMHDYRNNEICSRYQRGQCKGLDEIEALIESHQDDLLTNEQNCFISVSLRENREMIGEIVVMPNDGCFSLGYTFSYRHHRKGYAYEALSALIQNLHEKYPDMEFISFTEPDNAASIGLLKKLGYTDYGYIERITSNMFGKWVVGDPLK